MVGAIRPMCDAGKCANDPQISCAMWGVCIRADTHAIRAFWAWRHTRMARMGDRDMPGSRLYGDRQRHVGAGWGVRAVRDFAEREGEERDAGR